MPTKRIAIAGLGEIGKTVARKLAQGLPGLVLSGIATRDRAKAQAWLDREGISCPLLALDELPEHADLVVECAPAAILDQICRPMLNAGKQVMVLSASAFPRGRTAQRYCFVRSTNRATPTRPVLRMASSSSAYGFWAPLSGSR